MILFQNIFFWVAFADDEDQPCEVCSRMSNEMQLYVNFQVEMIWALSQVYQEKEIYSGRTKRGLFSYWALSVWANFLNSLAGSINKLTQSAVDVARSAELAAVIVTKNVSNLTFSAEWLWGFLILFRQRPFVRDWNTLQEIDSSLDDLLWDVGMQWMLRKSISSDTMWNLNDIVAKYVVATSSDKALFAEFKLDWNARYEDVILLLCNLNTVMQNFFTVESIFVYDKKLAAFESKLGEEGIFTVSLNHKYLQNLSDSYACVKGKAWFKNCGWSLTDFANDISSIWTDMSVKFSNALKEIKDSSKKLAEAGKVTGKVMKNKYSKSDEDLWLTEDQLELLRSVYGINTSKLTKQQWLSLSTILNWTAGKNLRNSITIDSEFMEEFKEQKEIAKGRFKILDKIAESLDAIDSLFKWRWAKRVAKWCIKTKPYYNDLSDKNQKKWNDKCTTSAWSSSTQTAWASTAVSPTEKLLLENQNIDSYLENLVPDGNVEAFTWLVSYLNESMNLSLSDLDMDAAIVMYSQNKSSTRYFVEIWYYIHSIVDKVIGSKNWWSDNIVNNLGDACKNQCSNKWGRCFY